MTSKLTAIKNKKQIKTPMDSNEKCACIMFLFHINRPVTNKLKELFISRHFPIFSYNLSTVEFLRLRFFPN